MTRLGTVVGRIAIAAISGLIAGAFMLGPFGSAQIVRTTTPPAPVLTTSALLSALHNALTIKNVPANLVPSLTQLAGGNAATFGGASYLHPNCDPYNYPAEATNPQPCWYGSTNVTAPVIVIFGDSFTGNWIPALDLVGKHLTYRIAVFEFAGCATPFVDVIWLATPLPVTAECKAWHSSLPAAVVPLHAKAIIAANGSPTWGAGDTKWLAGLKLAFTNLNPSGTSKQILLGTGIHLKTPAPSCLAAYYSNVQKCTFHYLTTSSTQKTFNRDVSAINSVGVHLIKTYPWACVSGACPVTVSNAAIYVDSDHTSVIYSKYVSRLLQSALVPLLK